MRFLDGGRNPKKPATLRSITARSIVRRRQDCVVGDAAIVIGRQQLVDSTYLPATAFARQRIQESITSLQHVPAYDCPGGASFSI
jgi:hypothetical protein